jgi:hypothetical protein
MLSIYKFKKHAHIRTHTYVQWDKAICKIPYSSVNPFAKIKSMKQGKCFHKHAVSSFSIRANVSTLSFTAPLLYYKDPELYIKYIKNLT